MHMFRGRYGRVVMMVTVVMALTVAVFCTWRHTSWLSVSARQVSIPKAPFLHQRNEGKEDTVRVSGITRSTGQMTSAEHAAGRVHVATVICGARQEEGLVMLKSLVALSTAPLMLHIFAQKDQHASLESTLSGWPKNIQWRVEYKLYDIIIPKDPALAGWTDPQFRLCSNHRLFLHSIILDADAVIYLDSDNILLAPIEELWAMFEAFNSSQLLGAGLTTNSKTKGWYREFAKHPYVPPTGVNSGVLLMNLTRLRTSDWTRAIAEYSQTYLDKIPYADQDLINIYLHFRPEQLYLLECSTNYRTDFCSSRRTDPTCVCQEAEASGAYILHGNRQSFKSQSSGLKPIYDGFQKYVLGQDLRPIVEDMKQKMTTKLPCNDVNDVFFKRLSTAVSNIGGHP